MGKRVQKLLIGRAGASPPSRTAAIIFLYIITCIYIYIRVVRRALNLLRASFSPIFQYFSAANVTRVFYFLLYIYFFQLYNNYTYIHLFTIVVILIHMMIGNIFRMGILLFLRYFSIS